MSAFSIRLLLTNFCVFLTILLVLSDLFGLSITHRELYLASGIAAPLITGLILLLRWRKTADA